MSNLFSIKKFKKGLAAFLLVTLMFGAVSTSFAPTVGAASSKYTHNHNGYTCYKMNYYVTPAKTKALAKQTKKLNSVSLIANFIGLSGLTPGIVSLVFGSAVSANNVFVKAAAKGKGVQMSYIAHFSNTTTDTYSSNTSYVIK